MLQSMRTKIKGVVAFFLIALLSIPLALVGVESLLVGPSHIGEVAEVDGKVISERELFLAMGRERQRLQAQFGANNVPADLISDERLREPVLNSLVERALLSNLGKDGNMTFSDQELDNQIVDFPDFQTDGRFDSQRFLQIVRSMGHTTASFRELLKEDLLVNQMQRAILSSDFITSDEIDRSVALSRQTRDFSWITLPLGDAANAIDVTEEEISTYYEENKQEFLSEEQVSIEYIELSTDQLLDDITVTEEQLREEYQQIVNNFTQSTEREAAHIMIEGSNDEAQAKIAAVKEKLAAGEDFAQLAKEYSDDFGSRDNGGNLGVSTGDSFPEEFEKALLPLEAGQISEAVEVDGATHFIKLVAVNENTPPSFDEQRLEIESNVKRAQAEDQFVTDVESLKELAYNAENLQDVAEQLGVTAVKTGLFSRNSAAESVLQDSRVLNAAFSEQVIQQGYASDVIESENKAVVIKLVEHKPVRTLTLDEKREEILSQIKLDKAKQQLVDNAKALRAALDQGADIATLAEQNELKVSVQTNAQRNAAGVPQELLESVFELPHPDTSSIIEGQHLGNGDYVLVSLDKVTAGSLESLVEAERSSLNRNLSASLAGDEFRLWQEQLRADADIDIYSNQQNQYDGAAY